MILSLGDVVEELAVARALARDARRPDSERIECAPWRPVPHARRVFFTRPALKSFLRVPAVDRWTLRRALWGSLPEPPSPTPAVWSASGRILVLVAVLPTGSLLVRHVFRRHELERAVIGEEVWARRRRVGTDRRMHGRWQGHRPRGLSG